MFFSIQLEKNPSLYIHMMLYFRNWSPCVNKNKHINVRITVIATKTPTNQIFGKCKGCPGNDTKLHLMVKLQLCVEFLFIVTTRKFTLTGSGITCKGPN